MAEKGCSLEEVTETAEQVSSKMGEEKIMLKLIAKDGKIFCTHCRDYGSESLSMYCTWV